MFQRDGSNIDELNENGLIKHKSSKGRNNSSQLKNISSYFKWSIFNVLFCLVTGSIGLLCSIPALVYSLKTDKSLTDGHLNNATKYSAYAKAFNKLTSIFVFINIFSVCSILAIDIVKKFNF